MAIIVYIELHAASAFSFLDGASLPEALVERAAALGYPALALLDRDGVYGAPRFHLAAKRAGLKAIIGAELTVRSARGSAFGSAARLDAAAADPGSDPSPSARPRRIPRGLSEPVPARDAHEAAAPKGEGALSLDELDGQSAAWWRSRAARCISGPRYRRRRAGRSARRDVRRVERLRRAAAASAARRGGRQPRAARSRRPRFTCRSSRPTASASPSRPIGRSTTCSPASATRRRSSMPAGV